MPSDYIYQPEVPLTDYQKATAALCSKYPRVKEGSVDPTPHLDEIARGLTARGVAVTTFWADPQRYSTFFKTAAYRSDYYPVELQEKSFEHFAALELLNPGPSDVLIDIAAEGSPLSEIAARRHGARAYAQDIMYPYGVSGNRIGGDACAMPIADGFATGVALTCSLEHFEGDGDTRLFHELSRVLRPGGKVVVIPLYLHYEAAIQSDPTYSAALDLPFDPEATIYCAKGWKNRHGRFYSPTSLVDRIITQTSSFRFTVFRLTGLEGIGPDIYARFALFAEH